MISINGIQVIIYVNRRTCKIVIVLSSLDVTSRPKLVAPATTKKNTESILNILFKCLNSI